VVSRRSLILGGAALLGGGAIASACGSGDADSDGTRPSLERLTLVQRFPQVLVTGEVRMPVSLATDDGLLTEGAPDELVARLVESESGEVAVDRLVARRHGEGLATPYWPFRATIDRPGIYVLQVEGHADGASVQIAAAGSVAVPGAGDPMPPFDTPTTADPRGVDPICTRTPEPCPLHTLTLTDALALGRPVAYLVGTPAFCSTGTCAPALNGLLAVRERIGDAITFVHADVYTDKTASTVAPAVQALNMTFEPALFLVGADGTVVERLDAVFDEAEIDERLVALGLLS